jgi:4-hydroxybenzoate polyprenyltransferase
VSASQEVTVVRAGAAWAAAFPLIRALRPRQWPKNLLLLAGLIFAAKLGDAHRWLLAAGAVAAYCAASSAAYLVNDVRDAESDRRHPIKRGRPVAAGLLAPRLSLAAAGFLALTAIAIGAALGLASLAFLLAFLALQAAYTARLKTLVLVDVLAIAALFVIRAAAGAAAVDVRISPWLLLCTALLALFLGLAKRRCELLTVVPDELPRRAVLHAYRHSPDAALVGVAALSVLAYAAYTVAGARAPAMPATVPLAAFGIGRYVHLVLHRELGEEPEEILLTDVPILACVAAWAVLSAALLAYA